MAAESLLEGRRRDATCTDANLQPFVVRRMGEDTTQMTPDAAMGYSGVFV